MAAAAKKTASSYYQWSEDEKRRYYTEFEAVPRNSREAWLKEHWPGNPSQFYRNRTAFLKAHPDFELGATSLESIVRAKKRLQTIRKQKNALPREQQLAQAAHAREALAAKRAAGTLVPKVIRPTVPSTDDTQAYLDEYLSLRGNGAKAIWLTAHGLTHKVMYEIRHRGRSIHSVGAFRPDAGKAIVPAHNLHAQILPAPPRDIPSLDDAINAMEIERDQLSAFIERLKRFRNTR